MAASVAAMADELIAKLGVFPTEELREVVRRFLKSYQRAAERAQREYRPNLILHVGRGPTPFHAGRGYIWYYDDGSTQTPFKLIEIHIDPSSPRYATGCRLEMGIRGIGHLIEIGHNVPVEQIDNGMAQMFSNIGANLDAITWHDYYIARYFMDLATCCGEGITFHPDVAKYRSKRYRGPDQMADTSLFFQDGVVGVILDEAEDMA